MEIIACLNETILTQIEDENIETEMIGEAPEFMDEIDICLTTLEDVTRVETEEQVVTPPTQGIPPQQADITTAHGVSNSKARLPNLHLPSFGGKLKEWSTFWVTDFLRNRQQRVKLSGVFSDWLDVPAGVPQGTRLGP